MQCYKQKNSFTDCKATTLHHWAGMKDGRYSNPHLLNLLENDISLKRAKSNIQTIDTLIIDEISMISADVFSQLEFICRNIRYSESVFGGIQIIVVGDFKQLKPVSNNQDAGQYCFTSRAWQAAITHVVVLKDVVRQQDPELISAIHELASGEMSDFTIGLLESFSRPLPPQGDIPIHLFARNFDVDLKNFDYLNELPGIEKVYTAESTGPVKYSSHFQAPKHLVFKQNCKVMLLTNRSPKLVNGSMGNVVQLNEKDCVVHFDGVGNETIQKQLFTVYSRQESRDIATRNQLPLRLAYATTIHKAQGMNLERVVIDATNVFQPGQLATAVGRVITRDGLQIVHFDPSVVPKQPVNVTDFYDQCAENVLNPNFTCCRENMLEQDVQVDYPLGPDALVVEEEVENGAMFEEDSDDETLANELEALVNETLTETSVSHENIDNVPENIFNEIMSEVSEDFAGGETLEQYTLKEIHAAFLPDNIKQYIANIWAKFDDSFTPLDHIGRGKLVHKDFRSFLQKSTQYEATDAHEELLKSLCSGNISIKSRRIAFKYFIKTQEKFLSHKETTSRPEESCDNNVVEGDARSISDISKAGIRYLAGMCVAKCKFKLSNMILNNLHKRSNRDMVNAYRQQRNFLLEQIVTQDQIQSLTSAPESLQTIVRKQNLRQGLTHVSDKMFDFFLLLDNELGKLLTMDKFKQKKGELFVDAERKVMTSTNIIEAWGEMFDSEEEQAPVVEELMKRTILSYIHVRCNQFCKDKIGDLRESKSLEIRKAIWNKGAGGKRKKSCGTSKKADNISMAEIESDVSISKLDSHNKLKSHGSALPSKLCSLTKENLKQLSRMYGVNPNNKSKKETLASDLAKVITESSEMIGLNQNAASSKPTQRKRKAPVLEEADDYRCPICSSVFSDDTMWVGCDNDECGAYVCRNCTDLDDDDEYQKALATHWTCPLC